MYFFKRITKLVSFSKENYVQHLSRQQNLEDHTSVESFPNPLRYIQDSFLLCCLKEWILDGYPVSDGAFLSSFLLEKGVIVQKLTHDVLMAIKLRSVTCSNDIYNAKKQFLIC